jgi:16S rRNA (adenine1518-N6/adenine1519-N6)-dimethyltransferase
MVQREVGERWTAGPGSKLYGGISVKVAYHAHTRIVGEVSPTVFLPPPKVDSVLVRFDRHPPPVEVSDPRGFCAFVTRAFGHRLKKLSNALAAAGIDRTSAIQAIAQADLPPDVRPEAVGIEGYAAIYRELERTGRLLDR